MELGADSNQVRARAQAMTDAFKYRLFQYMIEQRAAVVGKRKGLRTRYPEIEEAFEIYGSTSPKGGLRWVMEAYLMTGADFSRIATCFDLRYGDDTVQAFAKLFFDVADILDRPALVQANILAHCLTLTSYKDDVNFTWKLVAYNWKFAGFTRFMTHVAGGRLPQEMRAWISEVTSDKISLTAMTAVHDTSAIFQENVVRAIELARNSPHNPRAAGTAGGKKAEGDAGDEFKKHIQQGTAMVSIITSLLDFDELNAEVDSDRGGIEESSGLDWTKVKNAEIEITST